MQNYRVIINTSSSIADSICIACAKSNSYAVEYGSPSMTFKDIEGLINCQKVLYPALYKDVNFDTINTNMMVLTDRDNSTIATIHLDEFPDIEDEA